MGKQGSVLAPGSSHAGRTPPRALIKCIASDCWCSANMPVATDTFDPKVFGPQPSQRIATVLIYLSDVEEGGETVFKREGYGGESTAFVRGCHGVGMGAWVCMDMGLRHGYQLACHEVVLLQARNAPSLTGAAVMTAPSSTSRAWVMPCSSGQSPQMAKSMSVRCTEAAQ